MGGYACHFADLIGHSVYVGVIETNIPVRSIVCHRSQRKLSLQRKTVIGIFFFLLCLILSSGILFSVFHNLVAGLCFLLLSPLCEVVAIIIYFMNKKMLKSINTYSQVYHGYIDTTVSATQHHKYKIGLE